MCIFCGDDAVEEYLGGEHVGCGCAAVSRVCDSVATNGEALVWVIFFRSVVCTDSSVCDIFMAIWINYVGWNEDYSFSSLDDVGDALG